MYSIRVPPGRAAGGRPIRGRGQRHPRCGAGLDGRSARCPRELVTVASAGDQERKECGQACGQIGFPEGINVWLDLEGAKTSTPHETMIAYCNAWFAEVEGAGFVPGVYVGARAILPGERTVLAFDDQTLLEVRKQGSRHSAPRLSAHSDDHPQRQDRRCCDRSQPHQERQLRRLRAVAVRESIGSRVNS